VGDEEKVEKHKEGKRGVKRRNKVKEGEKEGKQTNDIVKRKL
jgi:hypothetical protein